MAAVRNFLFLLMLEIIIKLLTLRFLIFQEDQMVFQLSKITMAESLRNTFHDFVVFRIDLYTTCTMLFHISDPNPINGI